MLIQLIDVYSLVVLGAVVVSWFQLPQSNPVATFLHALTEPLLGPIRRVVPAAGGLDFSPLILLFGLRMLRSLLLAAAGPGF